MFGDILLLLHCVVTRHRDDDFSDGLGKFFHLRRTMRRISVFDILYYYYMVLPTIIYYYFL